MQTLKSVLIILVVFGGIFILSKFSAVPKSEDSVSSGPGKVCYIWNTEAGDKGLLVMNINGEKVDGTLDIAIAQKDKKSGSFTGDLISLNSNADSTMVYGIWDNMQEGVQNKEQLWIKLNGSVASPGFGPMQDGGKGIYVYADPGKISYDLNLQKADCATVN